MGRIVYVGLPSKLHGKHLMRILTNLKDFGVGRMFTRNRYQYKEPTFYIVKKVEPAMDPDVIWGKVHAQEYFRGIDKGVRIIESHLADFRMVPKEDEQKYLDGIIPDPPIKILPRERPIPPLLKILIQRDIESRGEKFDPNMKIPVHYSKRSTKSPLRRVAEPGEKPAFEIDMDKCPLMYDELKQDVEFDVK